jgi:sortase (surface protein transpeptidase)
MELKQSLKQLEQSARRYRTVTAFAVLGMIVGATFTWFVIIPNTVVAPVAHESNEGTQFKRSAPVTLTIPRLNLNASFEAPLGLNPDKTVEVPKDYQKVGWYSLGPTPGEVGSAVILGHVDSVDGPAVFYSLPSLKEGDTIEVTRADGSVARFAVTDKKLYDQDTFPTELIYGEVDGAQLRLVTCTGLFDKGAMRYSHNYVVFARLID